ncbi:MAG: acyltransferase [Lacibacter sp.]
MQQKSAGIISAKQHFEILDGLRGVAALSVLVFHFMEIVITDYTKNFIGHGFLAVDFFFCLSGFVIGYAYDDRITKIGLKEFFKSRLIRLHPLVISGSVLGLLAFLFDPFGGHPELYNTSRIILIFVFSLLVVPFPVMEDRFFNLFGLNAPAWSLFWEYAANIVYAFILCRLNKKLLAVLCIISAVALGFIAYRAGNLMGGWSKGTFWDGGVRICYSFTAGLLIYRFNWIIKTKLGFIPLSILLLLAFLMPWFKWNWLAETLVVIFYFPLLVSLGAGAVLSQITKRIYVFSGNISYPLYMTHYAAMWMFGNYYNSHKPGTTELFFVITAGTLLLIGVSYLVMIAYDIPLRKYLTAKWRRV